MTNCLIAIIYVNTSDGLYVFSARRYPNIGLCLLAISLNRSLCSWHVLSPL
jgi:hypothetical protein